MDDRQNKSGTSKPVTGKISTAILLTISYSNIIVTTMMRITALRRRYTNYGYLQHKEELNLLFKQQVPSKNIDEAT